MDKMNFPEEEFLEETEEAMKLYKEISEVFIKNKTSVKLSYMVLGAMLDMLYTYIVSQGEDEE
jgi:uncharacterized protein YejL (UPF0352 family)